MEITRKDYFDENDGGFIGVRYFVDDEEISEDEYYDLVEDEDDEEDIVDVLVEEYTDAILETDGCPACIQEILYEFVDNIFDVLEGDCDDDCANCDLDCDYEE